MNLVPINSPLVNLILNFLFLIALGFASKKTRLFKSEDAKILNKFIIYFALPALTIKAVLASRIFPALFKLPILAMAVASVCLLVAFLLAKKLSVRSSGTFGGFLLAAMFGNTAYMGYPIALAVYGNANLVKAIFYDLFGIFILLFTLGLYIAGTYGQGGHRVSRLKEILTFPPLLALIVGFALKGVILPNFFHKILDNLSLATVPLIMFSIGLSLSLGETVRYKRLLLALCLVKLVFSPVLAYFVGKVMLMSGPMLGVAVLQASMPTAMMTLVIGLEYKLDTEFQSAAILTTTLLSLLTIPLGQYVLRIVSRA